MADSAFDIALDSRTDEHKEYSNNCVSAVARGSPHRVFRYRKALMLERALPKVPRWRCDDSYTPGTLLPFLYCTPTIQRRQYARLGSTTLTKPLWKHTSTASSSPPRLLREPDRNDAKNRHLNRKKREQAGALEQDDEDGVERLPTRSKDEEDNVPFEDASDEQRAGFDLDKSTITPRERQTFEKLFSLQKPTQLSQQSEDGKALQKHKPKKTGLDAILDSAVTNINARGRSNPKFPQSLVPLAEEAQSRKQLQKLAIRAQDDSKRSKVIERDYNHVTKVMTSAPTDLDTWRTLKGLVLNRVAALKLDTTDPYSETDAEKSWAKIEKKIKKKKEERASVSKDDPNLSELQILTVNMPAHLQDFMAHMTSHYPASPLSLNLLPALRGLGSSAFALGATTSLYNSHISLLHTHHPTAVNVIVETLEEMDREVYAFDDQTLEVVEKVLKRLSGYRHGHRGKAVQILFSSERVARGVKDLTEWRRIMLARRQEEALRKARRGMEIAAPAG